MLSTIRVYWPTSNLESKMPRVIFLPPSDEYRRLVLKQLDDGVPMDSGPVADYIENYITQKYSAQPSGWEFYPCAKADRLLSRAPSADKPHEKYGVH